MRIAWTDHLVELVARVEVAGARLADATADRRASLVEAARREAARLSARLDASPLEDETAALVDRTEAASGEGRPYGQSALRLGPRAAAESPPGAAPSGQSAGWARVLKLEGMTTQEVAGVEYANLLRCHRREPELAEVLFEDPLDTMRSLHAEICRGLVAGDVIGLPRRTEQAVHDGAQGRVIYHAPPPDAVPGLLDELVSWLGRGSALLPAVVVSGIVHERVLEWLPFEAANGRVARALSRLVLRARDVDPDGLAVPERSWAADPVGYYSEVAATRRRRGELAPWLERHTEAVALALEAAADDVRPALAAPVPRRAEDFVANLHAGAAVTLAGYAAELGVSRETARRDLGLLVRAGRLERESGTRGLRYRVR